MGFVGRYTRPGPTLKRVRSDRVCAQPALIPRKARAYTPHIPVSRDKSSASQDAWPVTPACACQFTASEVVNCPLCMHPGKSLANGHTAL